MDEGPRTSALVARNANVAFCKLPDELLALILKLVQGREPGGDGDKHDHVLWDCAVEASWRHATAICARVRALAVRSPELWACIHFSWPQLWVDLCVRRAGDCPLSISTDSGTRPGAQSLETLLPRTQCLNVHINHDPFESDAFRLQEWLNSAPQLRFLSIESSHEAGDVPLDIDANQPLVAPILGTLQVSFADIKDIISLLQIIPVPRRRLVIVATDCHNPDMSREEVRNDFRILSAMVDRFWAKRMESRNSIMGTAICMYGSHRLLITGGDSSTIHHVWDEPVLGVDLSFRSMSEMTPWLPHVTLYRTEARSLAHVVWPDVDAFPNLALFQVVVATSFEQEPGIAHAQAWADERARAGKPVVQVDICVEDRLTWGHREQYWVRTRWNPAHSPLADAALSRQRERSCAWRGPMGGVRLGGN